MGTFVRLCSNISSYVNYKRNFAPNLMVEEQPMILV